jgi:hypothetical protein
MHCISLFQPFASLMAFGEKRFETRGWCTGYRGPVCIASTVPSRGKIGIDEFLMLPAFQKALMPHVERPAGQNEVRANNLPHGKVLCVVDIYACVTADVAREMGLTPQEEAFGDYSPGRFVFLTNNLRRLPEPVPIKGQQQIYRIKDVNVETAVVRQLQKLRELEAVA